MRLREGDARSIFGSTGFSLWRYSQRW